MRLRWLYLLAAVPALTEFAESGRWPNAPRDFITDVALGLLVAGLVWLACGTKRLKGRSETDPVTGLPNSTRFHADLEREIVRAERSNQPLTLVYLGLDNFRAVNDAGGHLGGDALLREFAKVLIQNLRIPVDRCCRVGGDEFALILPNTDLAGAEVAIGRVRKAAAGEPCALSRRGVGISAGSAQLQKAETPRALVLRADSAMYDAKRGRDKGVPVEGEALGPRP